MHPSSSACLLLMVALLLSVTAFVPCQSFLMHDDIGYGRFTLEDGTTFLLEDENEEQMSKRSPVTRDRHLEGSILKALFQSQGRHYPRKFSYRRIN